MVLLDEELRDELIGAIRRAAPELKVLRNDENMVAMELYGMRQIVEAKDRPDEIGAGRLASLMLSAWERRRGKSGS